MNCKLSAGNRTPAVNPIKKWLNYLVIPNPGLSLDGVYDKNMTDAVRQFQLQNSSRNPHGTIDDITLYNILSKVHPVQINKAKTQNPAFGLLILNFGLPYDEDVHRYLTAALALAAGFSSRDAGEIGVRDQWVDKATNTQPLPTSLEDVSSLANYARLRDYHFVTPSRLEELKNAWKNSGQLNDIGTYMHAFQDSFSHKNLTPKLGQIGTRVDENGNLRRDSPFEVEWHQADDPSKRPALAADMAQQSYNELRIAFKICKDERRTITETSPVVPYERFSSHIGRFCKEPDLEKRKVLAKELWDFIGNQQKLMGPREGAGRANPR